MGVKVSLKKYLPHDGKWQFFPVLKVAGKPKPEAVIISGEAVKGTNGTFYLDWRENGKRMQKPCGSTPREALDAWRAKVAVVTGVIEEAEEETSGPIPVEQVSIKSAVNRFLPDPRHRRTS